MEYDREFFKKAGSIGGKKTAELYGKGHFIKIGSKKKGKRKKV